MLKLPNSDAFNRENEQKNMVFLEQKVPKNSKSGTFFSQKWVPPTGRRFAQPSGAKKQL